MPKISTDYRERATLSTRVTKKGDIQYIFTAQGSSHSFSSLDKLHSYLSKQRNIDTWEIQDLSDLSLRTSSTNEAIQKIIYKHTTLGEIETFDSERELNRALSRENDGVWKVAFAPHVIPSSTRDLLDETIKSECSDNHYIIDQSGWFSAEYRKYFLEQEEEFLAAIANKKNQQKYFISWQSLMSLNLVSATMSLAGSALGSLSYSLLRFPNVAAEQISPLETVIQEVRINTASSVSQFSPVLTNITSDEWVLAWMGEDEDKYTNIYAQRFSIEGTPLGNEIQVNNDTEKDVEILSHAISGLSSGDWVVVWQRMQMNVSDIYARCFARNGTALSDEFKVNDDLSGNQTDPVISALTFNRFVIVWINDNMTTSNIYAQRFEINDSGYVMLGSKILVNQEQVNSKGFVKIESFASGDWMVVWIREEKKIPQVFRRRFFANGTSQSELRVNSNTDNKHLWYPVIKSFETGDWVAAWSSVENEEEITIYARLFQANDSFLKNEFPIYSYNWINFLTSYLNLITLNSNEWIVSWCDGNNENAHIFAQRFLINGESVGNKFQVDTYAEVSIYPLPGPRLIISFPSNNWIVVWSGQDKRDDGLLHIYMQSFSASNKRIGHEKFLINKVSIVADIPSPIMSSQREGEKSLIVWSGSPTSNNGDNDIYIALFDGTRNVMNMDIITNDNNTGKQCNPVVTSLPSDEWVIAWMRSRSDSSPNYDLYIRYCDKYGDVIGEDLKVNTNTTGILSFPALVAFPSGEVVVIWYGELNFKTGIYAQRYGQNRSAIGSEFPINRNTTVERKFGAEGAFGLAAVNLSSEEWLVVWEGISSVNSTDIYAQKFQKDIYSGPEFPVNRNTTREQTSPKVIGLKSGGWAIAWEGKQSGDPDVYLQFFSAKGSFLGNETRINNNTESSQKSLALTNLENGDLLVAWQGDQGSRSDIYARIYSGDMTPLTKEFPLNGEREELGRFTPALTTLSSGKLLAAWQSYKAGSRVLYGITLKYSPIIPISKPTQEASSTNSDTTPTKSSTAVPPTISVSVTTGGVPSVPINSTTAPSGSGLSGGAIAGIATAGGVCLVALIVGGIVCYRWKKNPWDPEFISVKDEESPKVFIEASNNIDENYLKRIKSDLERAGIKIVDESAEDNYRLMISPNLDNREDERSDLDKHFEKLLESIPEYLDVNNNDKQNDKNSFVAARNIGVISSVSKTNARPDRNDHDNDDGVEMAERGQNTLAYS